ncbi:hypothetical protein CLV62_13640 [Dysgonomonas alginatilytica]|uniref:Uncharacterized protein n=1 Tax=Dysgonomonas alginatilytica TaxID=1605892 RepID=A0A2V3PJD7_9BACT|nr:hypothetical protein [Dysgonomonas alginatilytica]PXV59419.1 hypothetical protein CLV62_13640 [Dysgonomonas alginatilytica]
MRKIIIYILFLISYTNAYGQYKPKSEILNIKELKVVNEDLFHVLDSIIDVKSKVTYFKDGTLFTMWFGIDSIKPDLVVIWAEGKKVVGANHDLGLFDYKENTFLVRGENLDTTVFAKTDRTRKFDFTYSPIEVLKGKRIVFDLYADDRFCTWTCRYRNGKFILLSFESSDSNVKSFDNTELEYQEKED